MTDPQSIAMVVVAVITGGATLWTQRGGPRAQRRTADIQARAHELEEFKVMREEARKDVLSLRDEVEELRAEVRAARGEALENALLLDLASNHIRRLRPLVPDDAKAPPLPDLLKNHGIGV